MTLAARCDFLVPAEQSISAFFSSFSSAASDARMEACLVNDNLSSRRKFEIIPINYYLTDLMYRLST